ncbi:MAG: hypothetical protein E7261_06380 [Lachnospiraceae bacterium]|nr:hypothetical protein [Lachnospiraceae bacterium]
MKREDILKFFDSVGHMMYIRTLKTNANVHGFFDDRDKLENSLNNLSDDITLYFNAQIIDDNSKKTFPHNQFKKIEKGKGLKDENIEKLRYIVLDIDVASKNKESKDADGKMLATTEENISALNLAKEIKTCLENAGFINIGVANSGNGAYVILPMKNRKTTEDLDDIIGYFIYILNNEFAKNGLHIDSKTINPARIFKVPGTLSTKGIATDSLPYRYADVIDEFDFSQKNSWKLVAEYIDKYGYATNLVYFDSKGKLKFDFNAVCEESVKFFDVFRDQYDNLYAQERLNTSSKIYDINSILCESAIRKWLRRCTGMSYIPQEVVDAARNMMLDEAQENDAVFLSHRIFATDEKVLYNLGDGQIVKVTHEAVEIVDCPSKVFLDGDSDAVQIMPDLTAQPNSMRALITPFFNIKEERDWILLLGFLGSCFMGMTVSHPILYIGGEKGAAKSTATKWLQSLVSPKHTGLCRFPTNERDISIVLSKELFMAFDNMGGIKNSIGDLLCQAATGGTSVERKLYTNNETVRRNLKTILVLNGLNLLTHKEDLLDRVIIINLERIEGNERKTDKELRDSFDAAKPKILGALFNAVKDVFNINIAPIKHQIRLLDFEEIAIKFAIAFGWSQNEVEEAFKQNKHDINCRVVEENPVAQEIMRIMERFDKKTYSATELFETICKGVAAMPQSPSALIRRIGNITADLKAVGITYDKINNGYYKEITFYNDGSYVLNETKYKQSDEYLALVEKRKKVKKTKIMQP